MQVGAENKNKLIAAIVLAVLAAVLLARWIFSSDGATAQSPSAVMPAAASPLDETLRVTAPTRKISGRRKAISAAQSLDPTLRYDLLRASEDTQYKGSGRNIFQAQVDIPKPIQTVRKDKPVAPPPSAPPGPPPPPPIDLKFFGFASRPGEPKRVFLSQGEDVFIAGEGDIVDRRYKVLRISAASVEIEDVLNNNRQEIFLSQG
jgi:hypothetical protein